jgi:hypothetical protein
MNHYRLGGRLLSLLAILAWIILVGSVCYYLASTILEGVLQ